jgi:hypothetical protein
MRKQIVLLFIAFTIANGISLWGNRKKKTDEDSSSFEELRKKASTIDMKESKPEINMKESKSKSKTAMKVKAIVDEIPLFDREKLEHSFEAVLTLLEEIIESDEFQHIVTYDNLQELLSDIPMLANNPQMREMLSHKDIQTNPTIFKNFLRHSLISMKELSNEIIYVVTNKHFQKNIPPEFHSIFQILLDGNFQELKPFIDNIPGITSNQKLFLTSLLDNDVLGITKGVNSIFESKDDIEVMRRSLLENPSLMLLAGKCNVM